MLRVSHSLLSQLQDTALTLYTNNRRVTSEREVLCFRWLEDDGVGGVGDGSDGNRFERFR